MPKTLTDKAVNNLQPAPEGKRYIVGDAVVPGLGVRVTDKGHKTYVLGARFPGSRHFKRREIGQVGAITLAKARDDARDWIAKIQRGEDPKNHSPGGSGLFADVAEEFIARHLRDKRKGPVVAREIRRELMKVWGTRPINQITRRDVVALLEAVKDRSRTGAYARNVWSHIKTVFEWAIDHDYIETSPCDRIKPKRLLGQKQVRDRVLNDAELRALWRAANDYPTGSLVRWFMLTGCRLNEALGATWGEFQNHTWTIPAARFKMNAVHIVPLTDEMNALLVMLPRWANCDYLFSVNGSKPYTGVQKAKVALDSASGVSGWTFHDLRRTMRTRMSALRIPIEVAELTIGHSKTGLSRVYDQHKYLDEVREAFVAWNKRLMEIVS
jgi:integrase